MMKKLIIAMIILLLVGGCIFFFGWIQILLPAETYAVIFTKTGGFDSIVAAPGIFLWRWERLIPTNMTIYKFKLHPYSIEVPCNGSLPSSDLYSNILPDKPDFSYDAIVLLKFRVNPEFLPGLVEENKLNPETISDFNKQTAQLLADEAVKYSVQETSNLLLNPDWKKRLTEKLEKQFPYINIIQVDMKSIRIPDIELYNIARDSYRSLIQTLEKSRKEAAEKLAEELEIARIEAEIDAEKEVKSLERLREYGKLLTEYPILLKAIYVQQLSGNEEITIPEFELPKILENSGKESP